MSICLASFYIFDIIITGLVVMKKEKENKTDGSELKVSKEEIRKVKGIANTKKAFKMAAMHKGLLTAVIVFFILNTTVNVINALLTKEVLSLFTSKEFDKFTVYALIFLALEVLIFVFEYFQYYFYDQLKLKMDLELKTKTYQRISSLKASCFATTQTSTFTSRVNEATSISNVLDQIFGNIYGFVTSFAYVVVIAINAPILFAVTAVFYLVKIFVDKYVIPKHNALRRKNRKISDEASNIMLESIRGAADVKSLNFSEKVKTDYFNKSKEFYDKGFRITVWRRNWGYSSSFVTNALNSFVMLLLIGYFMTHDVYSAGSVLFFWSYKGNIRALFQYTFMLKERFSDIEVSASRMMELWDEEKYPVEVFGEKEIKNFKGKIIFKNVHFAYEEEKPVLCGVNLDIEPNKITAIVGKTGCGKSTTLSLIARFYDAQKGKITLDGVNIKDLSKNALRSNIGYVQQTPYIFNRSFKENLLLVKPDASDDEIVKACKNSEIHDFIMTTKDGYDTLIGENGITLSGGQRQRLAIARALLNNAKIIMFDESTSALDNENQAKIQAVIEKLSQTHTIIVVAHRLSTIINADKIIFMDNAKIIAEGTHDELFKNCKEYQELYQIENI